MKLKCICSRRNKKENEDIKKIKQKIKKKKDKEKSN